MRELSTHLIAKVCGQTGYPAQIVVLKLVFVSLGIKADIEHGVVCTNLPVM